MISCLTVTQQGREDLLRNSIYCFAQQSVAKRELVVVHDGGDQFHRRILAISDRYSDQKINVVQIPHGRSLGYLRNTSVQHAEYDIICQWDDDDLYHPQRLQCQYEYLLESRADFCFLGEQLHLFSADNYLFWDDWSCERYPGNLIQGTLMGNKQLLGSYPDKSRGEDTELVHRLSDEGHKLCRLNDYAWLYIYVFHGSNVWASEHHKAISQLKRLRYLDLKKKLPTLERELNAFAWRFESLYLPHEKGGFSINPESGERSD